MRFLQITALSAIVALGAASVPCSHASAFPKDSPSFVRTYGAALAAAKQTGKPVVIIFSASWCPPCQENKTSVYPNALVKPYHDKFIWAYLDADEGATLRVMDKFGVDAIPHIQFLSANGDRLGSVSGSTSPRDFVARLTRVLKQAEESQKRE